MSAIPEDKICRHCGFDNNNVEPRKMRQLLPGTILKNRFLFGLCVKSNNIFTKYIAYDVEKKKIIYIDEFLPAGIAKRGLGKLGVVVRDENDAKFEIAKRRIKKQVRTLIAMKCKELDILGAFSANNTFYIIREYLSDGTLAEYIKNNDNISLEYANHIVMSLIRIMSPIHNEGIICGNIRPENIVTDAIGSVKLINFGFGGLSDVIPVPVNEGYSPVEMYDRGRRLSPAADVYSIAAVYYALVSGETPVSSISRRKTDSLAPLSTMGIKIDRHLENAMLNALNINPNNRTSSVKALYNEMKNKDTKRRWERVKAMPKKDYSFFIRKAFWFKVLIFAVIVIMAASLVGIIHETANVENRIRVEEERHSEISTMAVPSNKTEDISNKIEIDD